MMIIGFEILLFVEELVEAQNEITEIDVDCYPTLSIMPPLPEL